MKYEIINEQIFPTLKEQVFFNRKISERYLNTTTDDLLSPQLLANVHTGASMLIKHLQKNDKICVVVDPDVDGYTSSALLINYLHMHFPTIVENNMSYIMQDGKEHGIVLDKIPADVKLVIAPDSASNDYTEHKQLYDKNIDVLVIDHHEAEEVSEYACVINNQLCNYPNKFISGAGVALKFCEYFDSLSGKDYVKNFYDLAAIGCISDMMDIRDLETKEIIELGLNNIYNNFMTELIQKQDYSISRHGKLDPFAVSFYIAPLLNSVVRSGTAEEKNVVFTSMIDYKSKELIPSTKRGERGQFETYATQAVRICSNTKSRQTKENESLVENIKQYIDTSHKLLVVVVNCIENKNLTGLVANQLASEYQKPTLILRKTENGYEGSGRNFQNSPLEDFREWMETLSDYVLYAQGHASAFGCGIAEGKLEDFIKYTDKALANFTFDKTYKVDKIYQKDISITDIYDIDELKFIWGQELAKPIVAIEKVVVHKDNVSLRSPDKYPTLVITLPSKVQLIKFNSSLEEYEQFSSLDGYVEMSVVGTCSVNYWKDISSPQVEILEYNITKKENYYF